MAWIGVTSCPDLDARVAFRLAKRSCEVMIVRLSRGAGTGMGDATWVEGIVSEVEVGSDRCLKWSSI